MHSIPLVKVTDIVGYASDGALYCPAHVPSYTWLAPVFRSDATYDDVCDTCFEPLDEYATDPNSVYDNFDDPMYTPDEHGAPDSLYFPLA
ncbi:MAG TPA: hypothetical protein VGJ60_20235 [Chloroflexota bacterium]|jgi:hypothetical protein